MIIKVAFLLNVNENWLGGLNYFRSLLLVITENKDLEIEPILFINGTNKRLLSDYPKIEIIESDLFTRYSFLWIIRKILCKILNRDYLLERFLKKYNIDCVSHLQENLSSLNMPTTAWIPDFQHKYLPELFSKQEINERDANFYFFSKMFDTVILSSYDAQKDFFEFFPEFKSKAEVLQFVVPVDEIEIEVDKSYLKQKYDIEQRFFYLPNQYWIHKNHKIVLDALNILKKQNKNVRVVSSGNTGDYRNEEYFLSITQYIKDNDLEGNFKILGKIPYQDVKILSKECLAFINPSLFEGWSTTVEEAKSMGKKIILSDLAVHKEQNPQGGCFFDRYNANDLANIMWKLWNLNEDDFELREMAKADLILRRRNFAETYKNIVINTIKRFKGEK